MLKGDWLTVCNVTKVIYCKQTNVLGLYKFDKIEPIARFFYLQMNVLTLLHTFFWWTLGNVYSF